MVKMLKRPCKHASELWDMKNAAVMMAVSCPIDEQHDTKMMKKSKSSPLLSSNPKFVLLPKVASLSMILEEGETHTHH